MADHRFEDRYHSGDTPWDHGMVDFNLVQMVAKHQVEPCRALDIGCGTGQNAIWLAQQGFDVVACDFSPTAIERARTHAKLEKVAPCFIVADFLVDSIPDAPFEFIFDRGCLHCMDDLAERKAFAEKVAHLLGEGGLWLSLAGNADEPEREVGPPKLTAGELVAVIEPHFEILTLASGNFGSDQSDPPRAWICLMRKRMAKSDES